MQKQQELPMSTNEQRILVHTEPGLRIAVDPKSISLLEAKEGDTIMWLDDGSSLRDARTIGELQPIFARFGFIRTHRSYLVNLVAIRSIRKREHGPDWELTMHAPNERSLPISRAELQHVWAAFGER